MYEKPVSVPRWEKNSSGDTREIFMEACTNKNEENQNFYG